MDRRTWLQGMGAAGLTFSASGWMPSLAAQAAKKLKQKQRQCILLWMTGGPPQTDTFDMKPGTANGGQFKPIDTKTPGIKISQHLPKLAKWTHKMALLRGMNTKEGDHARGTYLMRTGHQPQGPVRYPAIGASVSKELGKDSAEIPNFVSIAPYRIFNQAAFGPGFLGPRYAPLTVGATDGFNPNRQQSDDYAQLRVDDLRVGEGVTSQQFSNRVKIWKRLQAKFLARFKGDVTQAQNTIYEKAIRMMTSDAVQAFDLSKESDKVRDAYGKGRFGQGCLMARRLVERGVPFVEVSLGEFANDSIGWDTHRGNFPAVKRLSEQLDNGWSMLMKDLDQRGLLESTTIVWMGEFGRTPKINDNAGRDHFPAAWTSVLAGGGIRGGTVHGKTSADGTAVEDGKVNASQLLATLCQALGIAPDRQNVSELGRPIRIAEANPVKAVLR